MRETLNLFVDEVDKFDTGEGGQETSMNHSIYSADRMTHLKIVVVALVVGILVAGFGISARNSFGRRLHTDREHPRDEGRQAGRDHELGQFGGSLNKDCANKEFTNSRGSLQPPKVAT